MRRLNGFARRRPSSRRAGLTVYSGQFCFPCEAQSFPKQKSLVFPPRHLLYGKGRGGHRIIFHIREDGQHVRVLRIWHAFRDAVTAADLEE